MGKFINQNLVKNESVIYECKPKWLPFWLGPLILSFIFTITAIVNSSLLIIPILILGWTYLKYKNLELAITSERIIGKHGVIGTHTVEQKLNKIESVTVNQGLIEKLFGCGTVVIKGSGGTTIEFTDIDKPFEFRKQYAEISLNK